MSVVALFRASRAEVVIIAGAEECVAFCADGEIVGGGVGACAWLELHVGSGHSKNSRRKGGQGEDDGVHVPHFVSFSLFVEWGKEICSESCLWLQ